MQAISLENETDTARLAAALESALPSRAVVVLSGTLGAGKTRFVQAFAQAAGIDRSIVTSPTFVLCQHYEGRRLIHHLDAYRMDSADDFISIGGLELVQDDAVTFIEWGERVEAALPEERVTIHLEIVDESQRRANLSAPGAEWEQALETTAAAFRAAQ